MPDDENDPMAKTWVSAFTQALADLGWTDGRNVRMDPRWGGADNNRIQALAQELVGLQPDIIVTGGTPPTVALQRETRTIPIVFVNVADPVPSGLVVRLDRPSGNITGFGLLEASLGGKWLELLSEIAPRLKQAAIMFNPDIGAPVSVFMPSFEATARSRKVEPISAPIHSDVEIETAIIALGREPGGGLVVMSDAFARAHRGPKQRTGGLCAISVCQRRRFALLRARPGRQLSSHRHLCRSHPARREAGRSSGAASSEI
jgi:putative tryptophan/tyrosine transport system substrate-binding protein